MRTRMLRLPADPRRLPPAPRRLSPARDGLAKDGTHNLRRLREAQELARPQAPTEITRRPTSMRRTTTLALPSWTLRRSIALAPISTRCRSLSRCGVELNLQGSPSRDINEGSSNSPVRSSRSPVAPDGQKPFGFPRALQSAITRSAHRGGDGPSSTYPKQRPMSST